MFLHSIAFLTRSLSVAKLSRSSRCQRLVETHYFVLCLVTLFPSVRLCGERMSFQLMTTNSEASKFTAKRFEENQDVCTLGEADSVDRFQMEDCGT